MFYGCWWLAFDLPMVELLGLEPTDNHNGRSNTDQQQPEPKKKGKKAIIRWIFFQFLILGVAGGSYYTSLLEAPLQYLQNISFFHIIFHQSFVESTYRFYLSADFFIVFKCISAWDLLSIQNWDCDKIFLFWILWVGKLQIPTLRKISIPCCCWLIVNKVWNKMAVW